MPTPLSEQGEVERLEEQILNLNQKKEDLLVDLKAAVLNLHEHLKQERPEGGEKPSAGTSECTVAERDASERKVGVAFILAPHSTGEQTACEILLSTAKEFFFKWKYST